MTRFRISKYFLLFLIYLGAPFFSQASVSVDFETGDFSQADFFQTSTREWTVTSNYPANGRFSSEAPDALGDDQSTTLNLNIEVNEDNSLILFMYRLSTEASYDHLIFSADGAEIDRWSGIQDYQSAVYTATAGNYQLSWTYSKDSSVSSGEDRVWIDDIQVIAPSEDSDNDGLTNEDEIRLGTGVFDPDTDDDGLSDGDEVNVYSTDPLQTDTDNDALDDGDEVNNYGTSPVFGDTDSDGFFDGLEVANNTNPNSVQSFPSRSLLAIDFETGSFSQGVFSREGDANWTVTDTNTISGIYSAESPETLGNSQDASLIMNANILIDGDVSYDFIISSEISHDGLQFFIDGELQRSVSGTGSSSHSFPISAGQRELRWTYIKDSSVSSGEDRVWIDNINLPGAEYMQRNLFINQLQSTGQCPTTEMLFTVSDGFGNPVSDLSIDDVSLQIAGQRVEVDSLTLASNSANFNINASITMDYSGSMSNSDIANMEVAATSFINQLSGTDSAEIIKFASSVVTVQDFTSDQSLLVDAISQPSPTSGDTAFYDSVYSALTSTSAQLGRNAVIAMTDGADNNSLYSLGEVIEYATRLGIPVFTIGLGNADEDVLQTMATSTGGQYFYAPDSEQLEQVYRSISATLQNQYRLEFTDPGFDNTEHELVMTIQRGGVNGEVTRVYTGCRDFSSQINQIVEFQCPVLQAVVTVADQYGNPFDGLTENNFVLSVDDIDTPILSVTQVENSQSASGISSALIMDYSGSMASSDIRDMEAAAVLLVESMADMDQAMVLKFDDDIDIIQSFTADKDELKHAINASSSVANGGGTAFFDAVYVAINETTSQTGRKAVIALTDGQDRNSGRSMSEVIAYANEIGIPVFTIGLGGADSSVLSNIAQSTGAQYFYAPDSAELQSIYTSLADVLQSQYLIEFEDAFMDNSQHNAVIDVVVSNQTVQSSSRAFTSCAASSFQLINFEFGDFSQGNFSFSGSQQWHISDEFPAGGTYSAKAPAALDNSELSAMVLTMNTTSGEISFDYAVSSEENYDFLEFYIDGTLQNRWSGDINYTTASFPLSAGQHEFRWVYSKDSSVSGGLDTAWIDHIVVPITVSGGNTNPGPVGTAKAFDYDGDGTADIAYRKASSFENVALTSDDREVLNETFGRNINDIPVSGDFDGDGIFDIAVRRPATHYWYVRNSSDNDIQRVVFGSQENDIPVPADYDGDGITDFSVWRPSTQYWYVLNSSGVDSISSNSDGITRQRFGTDADIPVPADYDGDGKADIALRRPSNQFWYIRNSTGVDVITGFSDGITRRKFGANSADIPVPADYDGDGKSDLAVRRPSTAFWYILNSTGTDPLTGFSDGISRVTFGSQNNDIPIPADYDGDGKADLAVRRPSTQVWYIKNSSGGNLNSDRRDGIQRILFGESQSDIPLAAPVSTLMTMAASAD